MTRNTDPPATPGAMSGAMSGPVPSCPICGRPAAAEARLRPFCSVRCADVDLGRWLTGQYRIPEPPPEDHADPDGSA